MNDTGTYPPTPTTTTMTTPPPVAPTGFSDTGAESVWGLAALGLIGLVAVTFSLRKGKHVRKEGN